MATTGVGFRWLDILEKDFDKAIVELDTSLTELEVEDAEIVYGARQKIATLSSCFAQLSHKALTIFQNSAKLEAELVDMREELVQARATAVNGHEAGDGGSFLREGSHARYEAAQFARENATLRETVLALHSELFGARLATKYLDKELAGRIQQLQLLGRDMRSEIRDSLWAQVEAEILLQRHKTLVRVCRGLAPCPPRPPPLSNRAPLASRPRTVRVRRSPHLGLGISVTGGREHGVPILISELETGGPAALTGQLYVGDAILAINDLDLTQACHKDAVQALQSVKGDCALCVQFIATDDDDQLSDDNYRFPLYPDDGETYDPEPNGSGATPTAPRTPEFNRPHSEARSASEEDAAKYTEPDCKPPVTPYPEYMNNTINNNLSILDMDDDSIKIEAIRNRGAYRGPLPASSNDSAGSTPVHLRRTSLKKKRVKPFDWRSKGAYRAVDDDPSSDDTETLPINGHGISTVFDKPREEPTPKDKEEAVQKEAKEANIDEKLEIKETPVINIPIVPLPPPQEVVIPAITTIKPKNSTKPNGLDSNLLRNKMFRIGSAKRVLETAPTLSNGDTIVDRIKYPSHLLTGDGDPDFGTPV